MAKWSEWRKLTKMQKKAPLVIKKWNACFWITFNWWGLAEWSKWWKLTEMQKRPLSHKKEMLILDYIQLLMISWVMWVTKVDKNAKKGPLSHQKMKCSFLDYVQLLMISQLIWVTKVDQNAKISPLSHQKWNGHFWITFNFWWSHSDPSDES